MHIQDLYKQLQVPFPIQEHMIDVASVTAMICDHRQGEELDKELLLTTALVHDLGNLVKVDFSFGWERYQQNLEYRQQVKTSLIEKYWTDCDTVTVWLLRTLWQFPQIEWLLACMGVENNVWVDLWVHARIIDYADTRVSIVWICSLDERLYDLQRRYAHKPRAHGTQWDALRNDAHHVESYIFAQSSLKPSTITHASTRTYAEQLWNYDVVLR